MGFKPVDHRIGALLFLILITVSIPSAVFSKLPYQMAFIGSLFWIILKFSIAKNTDDKNARQFDYLKYMDAEWDNLSVNAAGIFIIVPQMQNIVGAISSHVQQVEFTDLWYYTAGILSDGAYILAFKVASLKKKYEGDPAKTPPSETN